MSKSRGGKKGSSSPPPGSDMGEWYGQHDDVSSSSSSGTSGGVYTRASGKGTIIPPKPSPIRPRDRDRMFPSARDAGYSSAEVSHVSLGSAAHRHDPRHLRSENTVISRSSSMRRKHGGSPASKPLLKRASKRPSPKFSYPSTPSSRGVDADDEDADNEDGGVPIRGGNPSALFPKQGPSRARPLPHDFTHKSFKDLPSASDSDSSDGGVATSPRRGAKGDRRDKVKPDARHVRPPSPAEGPSPSRYHDGPPRDRHRGDPPPSLYTAAGASSAVSGSRADEGLSQVSRVSEVSDTSTLSPAAAWWTDSSRNRTGGGGGGAS